jgi:toxin ParE1/3/4
VFKLIVTELAHQDLDHIISYIAEKLSNPRAAGDFLEEVTACYGFLRGNPMMYERCQDGQLEQEAYRKAVIKNHLLNEGRTAVRSGKKRLLGEVMKDIKQGIGDGTL